jgi:uroporphyrin-III C-methyltransferase/precorrin-2 dehydrogenase/sirohydrochlorin ferrochelatase
MEAASLLPMFLKLEGRKALVVGGGRVAAGKVAGLRGTGARVTVVAPNVRDEVFSTGVAFTVERRAFDASDLDGAWLAIAAAPPEVNRAVAAAAAERHIFLNAVDDPLTASAYAGGVVRRGGVTVAISTLGVAPALAGLLREGLEALLPHDLGRWVAMARALRAEHKAGAVPIEERRPLLLRALNTLYDVAGLGTPVRARRTGGA